MASGKISHHGTADYRHKEQWDEEIPLYVIGPRDEHLKANGYGYGSYGVDDQDRHDIPNGGVMPDEYFADWTVERLQRHYEKPFFLACGFIRPHVPYTAPREYFDMFPLESIIVPETIEKEMTDIPLMGKALALGICKHI